MGCNNPALIRCGPGGFHSSGGALPATAPGSSHVVSVSPRLSWGVSTASSQWESAPRLAAWFLLLCCSCGGWGLEEGEGKGTGEEGKGKEEVAVIWMQLPGAQPALRPTSWKLHACHNLKEAKVVEGKKQSQG